MNLRRIALALLLLLAFINIGGCKKSETKKEATQNKVGVAMRLTTSTPPLKDRDPGTKPCYDIGLDGMFHGYYQLTNRSNVKNSFLLYFLIDYLQVPFKLDDELGTKFEATLKPNETRYFRVAVGPLEEGFHDGTMMLIMYPDKHTIDDSFRFATALNYANPYRVNLRYPATSIPGEIVFTEPLNIEFVDTVVSARPEVGRRSITIGLTELLAGYTEWLSQKVKPGEKFEYYVHVTNLTEQPTYFGLFSQMDYEQIPLSIGGPMNLYVYTPANEIKTYKLSFEAPKKKGLHELYVFGAIRPYIPLTADNPDDAWIEHGVRVPIVVE